MKFMNWKSFASLVGAIAMTSALAKADTITGELMTVDPGETVPIYNNGSLVNAWAGQIVWDVPGTSTYAFSSYCTQLYTDVYQYSTVTYNIVPLNTVPDLTPTAGTPTSASTAEAELIQDMVGLAPTTTNDQAAGLQVAIWKVIYDYSNGTWTDPANGVVTWDATTAWGADAAADLALALNPTNPANVVGLQADVQDQGLNLPPVIGGGPMPTDSGSGSSAVPEPGVVLSILSLASLVGVGKARKLLNR